MTDLPTGYQELILMTRYSRWIEKEKRRESWEEVVSRCVNYLDKHTDHKFTNALQGEVKQAILNLEVMPSMRVLMTAGDALDKDHVAAFNCSFIAVNDVAAFWETLYILMCGTGVGFSCERQETSKLPRIPEAFISAGEIVVQDSRIGWAQAFKELLTALLKGEVPTVDYSLVRPAGARLKTFGGRASGAEPLKRLFDFTVRTFKQAAGCRLNSLQVHDIMCMIGDVVVVGGVRRSAEISLSNLSDTRMRSAKSGEWYREDATPYRRLANNSVAYTEKPDTQIFLQEWLALVTSKSGERGIFNREAAQRQAARWGRRYKEYPYGTNPCCEIILRSEQFCNLTETIARFNDTVETLKRKIRIATILGTIQATLTKFSEFLRPEWQQNTEEERLLGVSITGIMDSPLLNGSLGETRLKGTLQLLRDYAREVNVEWAAKLGIPESAAITCVKPSGTTSQLCNTASGIHARYAEHYLRTIRIDKKDPVYKFLKDSGVPIEDDSYSTETTAVATFAIQAPTGCITRHHRTAIEQLEMWKIYQDNWCEHKPSVTIDVRESEWVSVGAWVYENFDDISGVSFLPYSDHVYKQAPYQELTTQEYHAWVAKNPPVKLDWSKLADYEHEDNTTGSQTLACTGNNCEI